MSPLIRHRYRWVRSVSSDYIQDHFLNIICVSQIILQGALLAVFGFQIKTSITCMLVLVGSLILFGVASLTPKKIYDATEHAAAKRDYRLNRQRQRLRRSNPELREVNDAYLDEIYNLQTMVF